MSVRAAWAEIDTGAIADNARTLAAVVAPAELCAVVKAYGYGHGPAPVAEAALRGGATWLAVALVEEGEALRRAGITAPILVLSEPRSSAMTAVVQADLRPALYTLAGVAAAAKVAEGLGSPLAVHVKVDTGMHRVGADPVAAVEVAEAVHHSVDLRLEGLWTHLAVADEPARAADTAGQLDRFAGVLAVLSERGIRPDVVHAANSAGAIAFPPARLDLVRCGIALYGLAPSLELSGAIDLRPALSLKSEVSFVKPLASGEAVSYGLRWWTNRDTVLATIPIGYADGVPRSYGSRGGEVLLDGRRCAVVGNVTMDQLLVDCGPGATVEAGDECVLIGRQGDDEVTAWEWATRMGTIAYEVVCGISARVPRIWV